MIPSLKELGIPAGNTVNWDSSTFVGAMASNRVRSNAVLSYYSAMNAGVESVRSFYSGSKTGDGGKTDSVTAAPVNPEWNAKGGSVVTKEDVLDKDGS